MTALKEIAQALDGLEYGREFPPDYIAKRAKKSGVVICYGSSDGLFEADGAIRDEAGGPGTICFDPDGEGLLEPECQDEDCPHEKKRRKDAPKVKLNWNDHTFSTWDFETTIPHEKFRLMEGGEVFCEGIVFSVDDLKGAIRP